MYINGTLIKIKLAIEWHCFHKCTHLIGNWERTMLFKKNLMLKIIKIQRVFRNINKNCKYIKIIHFLFFKNNF